MRLEHIIHRQEIPVLRLHRPAVQVPAGEDGHYGGGHVEPGPAERGLLPPVQGGVWRHTRRGTGGEGEAGLQLDRSR